MDAPRKKESVRWIVLRMVISRAAAEQCSAFLFGLGTTGIHETDETAATVRLNAYFLEQTDADELARAVRQEFEKNGRIADLLSAETSVLPDEDWMQKWKEGFGPAEVGSRLIVAPSWKLPSDPGGRLVIQIDPGMAFGTGTHETTRLCLEAIEKHWRGGTFLDAGTGTGILAIAAALLAPDSQITAIDADPVAVEIARENARLNGVSHQVEVSDRPIGSLPGAQYGFIAANLSADVISRLTAELAGLLRHAGTLVLSGLLTEQAGPAAEELRGAGLAIVERPHAGEWCALVARRGKPIDFDRQST